MFKLLKVTEEVTEIQLYKCDVFIGAGSVSKPLSEVTEEDKKEAEIRIVRAWLM